MGFRMEREGNTMFSRIGLAAILTLPAFLARAAEPPKSWIDPETGHRVVRLTDEPGRGRLYFNRTGCTAYGRKMVCTTPEGVSALDLETRSAKSVVKGRVQVIVTGHKTENVYYRKGDEIFATNVDTLDTRRIAKLPVRGSVATVNADETLLAGTYIEGDGQDFAGRNPPPGQATMASAKSRSEIAGARVGGHGERRRDAAGGHLHRRRRAGFRGTESAAGAGDNGFGEIQIGNCRCAGRWPR